MYNALVDECKREACRRYEEQKAVEARFIRERDEALRVIEEKDRDIAEKERRIAELEKALAEADKKQG